MDDLKFCMEILPKVSRTFALSIEALSEPLREVVRASYLLCRIVDTIEDDEDLPDARRQELFDVFVGLMEDDGADPAVLEAAFMDQTDRSPDHALVAACGAPFRRFRGLDESLREAARPPIIEMAVGMAEYAGRWQGTQGLTVLHDEEDLERYCYYVAGTVGNLLTAVFLAVEGEHISPRRQQELQQRSVAFGLGLQMTNIVKDVAADRPRGWCFLPASLCDRHQIAPGELLDPARREPAMAVVRDVVAMAEGNLEQALEYTLALPRQAVAVRLFVLVPMVLAFATLELVGRSPQLLDGEAVKVSRETVAQVLGQAASVVSDDEGIRRLCKEAAAGRIV